MFWENTINDHRPTNSLFYGEPPNEVRFANNDGAHFRDHRNVALRMFRESYTHLKRR